MKNFILKPCSRSLYEFTAKIYQTHLHKDTTAQLNFLSLLLGIHSHDTQCGLMKIIAVHLLLF